MERERPHPNQQKSAPAAASASPHDERVACVDCGALTESPFAGERGPTCGACYELLGAVDAGRWWAPGLWGLLGTVVPWFSTEMVSRTGAPRPDFHSAGNNLAGGFVFLVVGVIFGVTLTLVSVKGVMTASRGMDDLTPTQRKVQMAQHGLAAVLSALGTLACLLTGFQVFF